MDGAGSVKNKGVNLNELPDLETLVNKWQSGIPFDFKTNQSVHAHSDHYPFLLQGVPTGGLESVPQSKDGRGYGHTAYDTLDKVTNRELQDASYLAALITHRIAAVPSDDWPVQHRTPDQVTALLALPDYTEVAEFEKAMDTYYAENYNK